jgi:hypothetical protein
MKARLSSINRNLPEINFRQAPPISVRLPCLPAGYTLVSGSSSSRVSSKK